MNEAAMATVSSDFTGELIRLARERRPLSRRKFAIPASDSLSP
jgi:hypothetical protein